MDTLFGGANARRVPIRIVEAVERTHEGECCETCDLDVATYGPEEIRRLYKCCCKGEEIR